MGLKAGVIVVLLMTQVSQGIELRPDRQRYVVNEKICFELVNRSRETVRLSSPQPWRVLDEKGKIIYSPIAAQVIVDLYPLNTKRWCWDQTDMDGGLVPPGVYSITIHTFINREKKNFRVSVEIHN